jgi:ATP/maltotriose-dependent transcriptional regulator MalT
MQAADAAVREAERLGDRQLKAQALAGRAEIQIVRREPGLAVREAQRAVVMHRDLKDAVRETEDLRILGVALSMTGKTVDGVTMLREVIARATKHERPLLVALAQRDLAQLLSREGDVAAAKGMAQTARAALDLLGAKVEVAKLDTWLRDRAFQRMDDVADSPLPPPGMLQSPPLNRPRTGL